MDGRGPRGLEDGIRKHQEVVAWYGARNIPVELNEPHLWGLRDAPDVIFVVTAYLSAHNAHGFAVRGYIAQMMFNSPPGVSDAMDQAKVLAALEMVEPLVSAGFRLWRQTPTGLLSYPLDMAGARAHLAAGVHLQMALRPHIVHVVSHSEEHHAAAAEYLIEACQLARRAIGNAVRGAPYMRADPAIQERKEELIREAEVTLDSIRALAGSHVSEPFTDPPTLARAVTAGILDAPHLRNNPDACGQVVTRIDVRAGLCGSRSGYRASAIGSGAHRAAWHSWPMTCLDWAERSCYGKVTALPRCRCWPWRKGHGCSSGVDGIHCRTVQSDG